MTRNSVSSLCHPLLFGCFHLSGVYILADTTDHSRQLILVVCHAALMLIQLNQHALCLLSTWQIPILVWSSYFEAEWAVVLLQIWEVLTSSLDLETGRHGQRSRGLRSASNYAVTSSFPVLSYWLFINHPVIRRCDFLMVPLKVKLSLCTPWIHHRGVKVQLHTFWTLALDGREWTASHSGRFTPLAYRIGGWIGPRAAWAPWRGGGGLLFYRESRRDSSLVRSAGLVITPATLSGSWGRFKPSVNKWIKVNAL